MPNYIFILYPNLSDQDNRKSFLANDKEKGDNNTPKKNKGFLGGLFN